LDKSALLLGGIVKKIAVFFKIVADNTRYSPKIWLLDVGLHNIRIDAFISPRFWRISSQCVFRMLSIFDVSARSVLLVLNYTLKDKEFVNIIGYLQPNLSFSGSLFPVY